MQNVSRNGNREIEKLRHLEGVGGCEGKLLVGCVLKFVFDHTFFGDFSDCSFPQNLIETTTRKAKKRMDGEKTSGRIFETSIWCLYFMLVPKIRESLKTQLNTHISRLHLVCNHKM